MRFGIHVFADEREAVEALLAEGFLPVGREGTRHYRDPERTPTGGCGAPMCGGRRSAVDTRPRSTSGALSPDAGLPGCAGRGRTLAPRSAPAASRVSGGNTRRKR